jgi:hypothetical protein
MQLHLSLAVVPHHDSPVRCPRVGVGLWLIAAVDVIGDPLRKNELRRFISLIPLFALNPSLTEAQSTTRHSHCWMDQFFCSSQGILSALKIRRLRGISRSEGPWTCLATLQSTAGGMIIDKRDDQAVSRTWQRTRTIVTVSSILASLAAQANIQSLRRMV